MHASMHMQIYESVDGVCKWVCIFKQSFIFLTIVKMHLKLQCVIQSMYVHKLIQIQIQM